MYRKSLIACAALSALIERTKVHNDCDLRSQVAHARSYVTEAESSDLAHKYEEIARMLTGLIKHLRTSDRKHRG